MILPQRYREAGRYFARNPTFTVPLVLALAFFPGLPVLLSSAVGRELSIPAVLIGFQLPITVLIAGLVAHHQKRIFAHPRARLMPQFAAPHLLWIALIGVTAGALVPAFALLWVARNGSLIGLVSILLASYTAAAWLCSLLPQATILFILLTFYIFQQEPVAIRLQSLLDGGAPLQATCLLAFGVSGLLLLGRRTLRWNEEMTEYHEYFTFESAKLQQMMERHSGLLYRPLALETFFAGSLERTQPDSLRRLWALARHWEVSGGQRSSSIAAIWLALGLVGAQHLVGGTGTRIVALLLGSVFVAVFASLPALIQTPGILTLEYLRPVGRARWVKGRGLSVCVSLARGWLLLAGALVLLSWAGVPAATVLLGASIFELALVVTVSLLCLSFTLWTGSRLRNFPNAAAIISVCGCLLIVMAIAIEPSLDHGWSRGEGFLGAASFTLLLVSALLLQSSYKIWQEVEIG